VGGKEYESVDAMPADVRTAYERAVAANPSLASASSSGAAPPSAAMASRPPAIDADDSRRGTVLRIAVWVAVGLAVLMWLLLRR
jgi:hypothetical protein